MSEKTPETIAKLFWREATELERHAFCSVKMDSVDRLTVIAFKENIDRLVALNDELEAALSGAEGSDDA